MVGLLSTDLDRLGIGRFAETWSLAGSLKLDLDRLGGWQVW